MVSGHHLLRFFFFITLALGIYTRSLAQTLPENNPTAGIIDSLQSELDIIEMATNSARNAVNAFPDSSFLPDLLFQLSEWEVRRAKLQYIVEMEKYDAQMKILEADSTAFRQLEEPILTYEETLNINNRLMSDFSTKPFIDMVRYRSAICFYETGDSDAALNLFRQIVQQFPDSSYIPEIKFRLGECYFDQGYFEKALNLYDEILTFHTESSFFSMALYKKAWCHYRLNDYADALSSFFYLLNDINLLSSIDCELLGKTHDELVDETVRYIAISFADFGGIKAFLNFINSTEDSSFTPLILQKMAEVHFERNDYSESISINKLLIERYFLDEIAPKAQFNLFKCYEKIGDFNRAFEVRLAVVEKYGPLSGWAKINNSKENEELIDEILNSIDFVIATPYLERADSLFNEKNFFYAAETYKNYITVFEKDERVSHAAYYLAESYFELGEFKKAAIAYKYVVLNFPESEVREDAAFNRIVCYDTLNKNSKKSTPDTLEWIEGRNFYLIPLASKSERSLALACRDFYRWFPKTEKAVDVRLKLVNIFMKSHRHKLAEQVLRKTLLSMVKDNVGKDKFSTALSLMANVQFKQKHFKKAENYFTHLIKTEKDSVELVTKSKAMLASSRYKIAESYKDKGDALKAAMIFEKTAEQSVEKSVAESALFESALQYEAAGKTERAAINFEKFCMKFPRSENIDEAFFRAATLREKLSEWHLAAANYMAIYRRKSNSPEGASALIAAATDYENAESWHHVIKAFTEFMNKYADDDRILEAMFKVAYAQEQNGKKILAARQYEQVVDKHYALKENGAFADDYIAAQARFRMGELKHDNFVKIKLKPPFDKYLKLKQNAFNDMLKNLVEVARYNVGEWTTASFYRIGSSYEEFCDDILNSPPPSNLTRKQLADYWDTIQEKWIVPLRSEALKYHETNDKLAAENSIDNQWTRQSKDRFIELSQKLVLASPASQDRVKQAVSDEIKFKTKPREL